MKRTKQRLPTSWWESQSRNCLFLGPQHGELGGYRKVIDRNSHSLYGRWASDAETPNGSTHFLTLHWRYSSLVYSLFSPRTPLQLPPRGCAKSPAHTTHNGVKWSRSALSGLNTVNEFIPFWEKGLPCSERDVPMSQLPLSISDTPVGIISSANRREVGYFVLFFTLNGLCCHCVGFPFRKEHKQEGNLQDSMLLGRGGTYRCINKYMENKSKLGNEK